MDFELIICLLLILLIFVPILSFIDNISSIDNYDLSSAILIDKFYTVNRIGIPCFYLVYKFDDGTIKKFDVNEEYYYSTNFDVVD